LALLEEERSVKGQASCWFSALWQNPVGLRVQGLLAAASWKVLGRRVDSPLRPVSSANVPKTFLGDTSFGAQPFRQAVLRKGVLARDFYPGLSLARSVQWPALCKRLRRAWKPTPRRSLARPKPQLTFLMYPTACFPMTRKPSMRS